MACLGSPLGYLVQARRDIPDVLVCVEKLIRNDTSLCFFHQFDLWGRHWSKRTFVNVRAGCDDGACVVFCCDDSGVWPCPVEHGLVCGLAHDGLGPRQCAATPLLPFAALVGLELVSGTPGDGVRACEVATVAKVFISGILMVFEWSAWTGAVSEVDAALCESAYMAFRSLGSATQGPACPVFREREGRHVNVRCQRMSGGGSVAIRWHGCSGCVCHDEWKDIGLSFHTTSLWNHQ